MIGYECVSNMYFEQDENDIMKYLESLNDGDKILLRDVLENLGVKQIPDIADIFDVIIYKPLYRKVFHNKYDCEIVICLEHCVSVYHVYP